MRKRSTCWLGIVHLQSSKAFELLQQIILYYERTYTFEESVYTFTISVDKHIIFSENVVNKSSMLHTHTNVNIQLLHLCNWDLLFHI